MNRTGRLERRKPLTARTPLARVPFRQAPGETAQGSPAREAAIRRPSRRKDTGPSRRTRALVLKRDDWCCVACGRDISGGWPYSLQHRLARGQGGGSEPFNLITMCGSATSAGCHRRAEDRDRHMHAAGFYLESWQNPRSEPVMLHGRDGGGLLVWLTDDGHYADAQGNVLRAPEAVA